MFFVVVGVSYFIVYRPLTQELKDQTYENYALMSLQKEISVEIFIEKSLEGASSLSSRTFIRNAIRDYDDEVITLAELTIITQPIYVDGFNALGNVISATRVVDGQIIAEINEPFDRSVLDNIEEVSLITYTVVIEEADYYVVVVSPITFDDSVIGHDVVIYNMTPLLEEFNPCDECINFYIINSQEKDNLVENAFVVRSDSAYTLIHKNNDIIFISDELVGISNCYVVNTINQDVLEENIQALTKQNILSTLAIIIATSIAILLVQAAITYYKVKTLNDKKEYFQEKANKDALTGVYSRHYLDFWLTRFKQVFEENMRPIIVLMCDINQFKNFNDTYGHQVGDKALKDIATIMKSSIRNQDLVFRYGGDEFLLIFNECNEILCETIVNRMNEIIKSNNELHDLSLAYGYKIIQNHNDIEEAINEADKLMYKHKRQLKNESIDIA